MQIIIIIIMFDSSALATIFILITLIIITVTENISFTLCNYYLHKVVVNRNTFLFLRIK